MASLLGSFSPTEKVQMNCLYPNPATAWNVKIDQNHHFVTLCIYFERPCVLIGRVTAPSNLQYLVVAVVPSPISTPSALKQIPSIK